MQATLPEQIEKVTLANLIPSEVVWTVPWAMYADEKGLLWLNGHYSFARERAGTGEMIVERTNGGYVVDISCCGDFKWTREGASYLGEANPIPVVRLVH